MALHPWSIFYLVLPLLLASIELTGCDSERDTPELGNFKRIKPIRPIEPTRSQEGIDVGEGVPGAKPSKPVARSPWSHLESKMRAVVRTKSKAAASGNSNNNFGSAKIKTARELGKKLAAKISVDKKKAMIRQRDETIKELSNENLRLNMQVEAILNNFRQTQQQEVAKLESYLKELDRVRQSVSQINTQDSSSVDSINAMLDETNREKVSLVNELAQRDTDQAHSQQQVEATGVDFAALRTQLAEKDESVRELQEKLLQLEKGREANNDQKVLEGPTTEKTGTLIDSSELLAELEQKEALIKSLGEQLAEKEESARELQEKLLHLEKVGETNNNHEMSDLLARLSDCEQTSSSNLPPLDKQTDNREMATKLDEMRMELEQNRATISLLSEQLQSAARVDSESREKGRELEQIGEKLSKTEKELSRVEEELKASNTLLAQLKEDMCNNDIECERRIDQVSKESYGKSVSIRDRCEQTIEDLSQKLAIASKELDQLKQPPTKPGFISRMLPGR